MAASNSREWPDSSLLGRLHGNSRDAILALGTSKTYAARQTLLEQDGDDRHVLFLLSGSVKVVVATGFGHNALVAVRGAGDLVGEMAALETRTRSASVIACVPVTARVIHGAELTDFLRRDGEACLSIARVLSERLRVADERGVAFIGCPAPTRVVRVLSEILGRHGVETPTGWELGVPLTQAEIASLAGTALSTVEKTFQALQREDLVRRHYRRIVVTDVSRLREFGAPATGKPY
jgi:CRP-like cAMP-binding protein